MMELMERISFDKTTYITIDLAVRVASCVLGLSVAEKKALEKYLRNEALTAIGHRKDGDA